MAASRVVLHGMQTVASVGTGVVTAQSSPAAARMEQAMQR